MSDEKKGSTAVFLGFLFFLATGVFALLISFGPRQRPKAGPSVKPHRSIGAFRKNQNTEELQTRLWKRSSASRGSRSSLMPMASKIRAVPRGTSVAPARGSGDLDEKSASRLGAKPGLLSKMVEKMAGHPKYLRAIFNNKLVVEAYMGRKIVRKNCQSTGSLKSYLMDGESSGRVHVRIGQIKSVLRHPEAAKAIMGSRLVNTMLKCPSVKGLTSDPGAVLEVMDANPEIGSLLTDPNAITSLVANPGAIAMYNKSTATLPR